MALPSKYTSFEMYLEDALGFLKQYSWIYNAPNTHLLCNKTLQKASLDWIDYFTQISNETLNKLTAGEVESNAPKSLKEFFEKIRSLKPTFHRYTSEVNISFPKNATVGIKKKHEIASLIPLIRDVCLKTNCTSVFDFGCGVGYISQILCEQYHYKIIGIEGCVKKLSLAEQYQKKFYHNSLGLVQYVHHYVTDNSVEFLENLHTTALSSSNNVCIIGLHVCADFCVTVLDIFKKLNFVKGLVIMPCCYHRMLVEEGENSSELFVKFPCSKIFREKYDNVNGKQFLRRSFLRIAVQRSNENWKDLTREEHEFRGKNCLFRAIIQEIVEEEKWRIKRLKRRSGLRLDESYNIHLAVQNLKETHLLSTQEGVIIDTVTINNKIFEKWESYKDKYIIIEAIVVLQNALQSMCENIILLDRIEYLKEMNIDSFVCKVTDDAVSPRCYGIVATKKNS